MNSIDKDWIKTIHDIRSITRRCQPAFPISGVLEEFSDSVHVHLLITVEGLLEDPVEAAEETDSALDLPLLVMHRRES